MKRAVITGVGVISPIASGGHAFFDALLNGACGIRPITKFDTTGFKATLAAEVLDFDPVRHGIPKSEARHMDTFTQYALAAANQAVEMSGILGQIDPERFGVYVGSGIGGMSTFMSEHQKLLERGQSRVSPFFIPMMIGNMAAGCIAIAHGAKGPCLPVVTACATSTHAVGEAFHAIQLGLADAILAGGAEATINPLAVAGFQNCKALTESDDPESASLPFDARRKGFVMGEGAGILLIEERERAIARGADILCEIAGYGNTCDAYHMTAPDPSAEGGARAMSIALREAGYAGEGLYINAHGTGTPMNDKCETLAIKKTLGESLARAAHISSTKSMTGHMLGAAGAVEAIASAMALKTGKLPPTIHLNVPDPECDLHYIPNAAEDYQAELALSVSLGFGGHNAAIALRRHA